MWILFEANTSNKDELQYESRWDIMGYTDSEEKAMKWRDDNPEYRKYQWCPDVKLD